MESSVRIVIPEDVRFEDLRLKRETSGEISFSWDVIERICEASSVDPALFRGSPEDLTAGLIVQWYTAHRERGGSPDPVADALLDEVIDEDYGGAQ